MSCLTLLRVKAKPGRLVVSLNQLCSVMGAGRTIPSLRQGAGHSAAIRLPHPHGYGSCFPPVLVPGCRPRKQAQRRLAFLARVLGAAC